MVSAILPIILLVPASNAAIRRCPLGHSTRSLNLAKAASSSFRSRPSVQDRKAFRDSSAQVSILISPSSPHLDEQRSPLVELAQRPFLSVFTCFKGEFVPYSSSSDDLISQPSTLRSVKVMPLGACLESVGQVSNSMDTGDSSVSQIAPHVKHRPYFYLSAIPRKWFSSSSRWGQTHPPR